MECEPGVYLHEGNCVDTCPSDFEPNNDNTACVMVPSDDNEEGNVSGMVELFGLFDGAEKISALYLGVIVTLSLTYFV